MIQEILVALIVAGSACHAYHKLKPKKLGSSCSGCSRCGDSPAAEKPKDKAS